MSWIESHQSLATHRKTKALQRLLNINTVRAVGHLHLLWWWCLDNAPDGNLQGISLQDIADAAMWTGDPQRFIDALTAAGFLDKDPPSLHDWQDYAGKYTEQKRRTLESRRIGGENRMALLSPEGRSLLAIKANDARWHPSSGPSYPENYPRNSTKRTNSTNKKEEDKEETATIEKEVKDSKKATTEADFLEYVAETKAEFPDLDCEVEFKKFTLYWSEGKKKLQRPKTAWHNWLEKAREFKNERGNSGRTESRATGIGQGLPGNRTAGAFADLQ